MALRPGCVAEGGRLAESCDARFELIPPFALALPRAPRDAAEREPPIVLTLECAPAAGEVRDITLRFCTEFVGRATLPRALAAPKALACEGVALM